MGVKEKVSGTYTEQWHDTTKNYSLPGERSAIVFGSDGEDNIGAAIARRLRDKRFSVGEHDIDSFDLTRVMTVEDFHWWQYDTAVFANGSTHLDWIEDQPFDEISKVVQNKLVATMNGVRQFVHETWDRAVIKNIVIIGSMAAGSVLNGSAPYCAACAGLQHFARCIAWELAPKGYRVFLLNPSNVEGTPMTEATIQGLMDYRHLSREDAEGYWGATRALPRWLQAGDIGEIVQWLVTEDAAEWLSGVPLNLGGGLR